MPPSQISSITAQWRSAYDNDSFHYVSKGAESEQPVGAPCYQWVDCRDHAGINCFPHSGSWQAQGGPAYICREQRKCVFYDMGPLIYGKLEGPRDTKLGTLSINDVQMLFQKFDPNPSDGGAITLGVNFQRLSPPSN